MSKEELLSLIDQDIMLAFIELDKIFLRANRVYDELSMEFVSPPNNYSHTFFRNRLKRFVSMNYFENLETTKEIEPDIDYFKLLCRLNFESQTVCFKNLCRHNSVSAFILHGTGMQDMDDIRWCYHQLLHEANLTDIKPLCVDFSAISNASFEALINQLYLFFQIENFNEQRLRNSLEKHLETSDMVLLVKHPNQTNDLTLFYNEFYKFYCYLSREVVSTKEKAFVVLFIEPDATRYHSLSGKYFLWHTNNGKILHTKNAKVVRSPKIIDLSSIEDLDEGLVEKWIANNMSISCVDAHLSGKGVLKRLIGEHPRPFHVIKRICNELKIDSLKSIDQWLSQ